MTRQERINFRNNEIRKEFDKLRSAKKNNVHIYKYAYILTVLEKKFFLGTETIEKILVKTNKNK